MSRIIYCTIESQSMRLADGTGRSSNMVNTELLRSDGKLLSVLYDNDICAESTPVGSHDTLCAARGQQKLTLTHITCLAMPPPSPSHTHKPTLRDCVPWNPHFHYDCGRPCAPCQHWNMADIVRMMLKSIIKHVTVGFTSSTVT